MEYKAAQPHWLSGKISWPDTFWVRESFATQRQVAIRLTAPSDHINKERSELARNVVDLNQSQLFLRQSRATYFWVHLDTVDRTLPYAQLLTKSGIIQQGSRVDQSGPDRTLIYRYNPTRCAVTDWRRVNPDGPARWCGG